MTALPERVRFFAALRRTLDESARHQKPFGLLVTHVQRMRDINISLGYATGDLILANLAQRIGRMLRDVDVLARIGDAGYGIILPDLAGRAHAELAAARIAELCKTPIRLGDRALSITLGIGVALYPEHGACPEDLLRSAEIALGDSYRSARGYGIYAPRAEGAANESSSQALGYALAEAIERRELQIYVQPKIDLRNGQLAGVEALLRWTRENGQAVAPSLFIPIAEQNNSIVPITLWSLHTALRQCSDYLERWPGFSVAVNLSPAALDDPDIFDLITQAANIWCSGENQLTLEVTESSFIKDPDKGVRILNQFHGHGIRLSIDDFGTGYSSLAQFSRLPISELKIDRSFVAGVNENTQSAQIVRAVVDLAHNFNMTVVAEGIEDEPTLAYLAQIGCDYGQGYYIGRPMPIGELEHWQFKRLATSPAPPSPTLIRAGQRVLTLKTP